MFLDDFGPEIRDYAIQRMQSEKDDIGQSKKTYLPDECIHGVITMLKAPREVGSGLAKTISEHVFYSDTTQVSKRGDIILDGDIKYEVIVMRTAKGFGDEVNMHYLELVE